MHLLKRNISKKVWLGLSAIIAIFAAAVLFQSSAAAAACTFGQTPAKDKCTIIICKVGQDPKKDNCISNDINKGCDPALTQCKSTGAGSTASKKCGLDCVLNRYVNPIINFLAIIVGLVVTIAITVGGIQYSTSAGDPQKAAKAKSRITNAIIALLTFLFLWAFLQWIIPGGFL